MEKSKKSSTFSSFITKNNEDEKIRALEIGQDLSFRKTIESDQIFDGK